MKPYFSICLLLLINIPLIGQLSPITNATSEVWHDKIPVSGEIRTGLMITNQCSDKVKDTFFTQLPSNNSFSYLNVEISSNDGHYNYTSQYRLSGQEGNIELERQTKLSSELEDYRCNDLTILAWLSDEINEEKTNFILSSWDANMSKGMAQIYVNSENPALIHIKNNLTGESKNSPCQVIKNQANVAYNCLCELSVSDISKHHDISIVQRVRRSQNRYPMNIIK